ncbi:FAD-dependent oxidoreductase [Streptomyces sp. NPDC003247]|uniref:FAD-dependent oxidoreductase n=1 Tax=Streptomyces sp. NPDC003247 TaxID=3364677 RepID=UPI0036B7E89E
MTARSAARSVLIVGGGIAGLTAAIALARTDWEVEVVEANPDWSVAGWGLSLTGPSLRALDRLGLADECLAAGYGIAEITNCDSAGEPTSVIALPRLLGEGRPAQAGLGRPALHRILREEAERRGAVLRTGATVTSLAQRGSEVDVQVSDGTSRTVDLVVGSDGIRSAVRGLLGIEAESHYGGQMVWRALVPRPDWVQSLHTFTGMEHNAGIIPISQDRAYVFVTENGAEPGVLPADELDWRMRDLIAGFTGRVKPIRDSIGDPADVVRRPVTTSLVAGAWHVGHTVLIGDAVHAPSPQMVSGAALAIEDGILLADELASGDPVETALKRFGARREPRCRYLVESSVRIAALEGAGQHAEAHALQQGCHRRMAEPA